jgi:hypothetical protein
MADMSNTSIVIAAVAAFIALIGGIPGIINVCKWINEKPKLSFLLRNSWTGGVDFDGQPYSYALIIFTIGNKGHSNFKRHANPEIEVNISGKWEKLRLGIYPSQTLEKIPDKRCLTMIRTLNISDYYLNNQLIPYGENIDVFLYGRIGTNLVTPDEIISAKEYRLTLKDVKNREYSQILRIK